MNKLKPYTYYNSWLGPQECAFLVFAHNAKEAKKIGWQNDGEMVCTEYIEARVNLLPCEPHIMNQAVSNEPHAIECPVTCISCGIWGRKLDENKICGECMGDDSEGRGDV